MATITCPGAANIKGTPTIAIKACPECGTDIEMFSTDKEMACSRCGFVVYNDVVSCLRWCRYADECLEKR